MLPTSGHFEKDFHLPQISVKMFLPLLKAQETTTAKGNTRKIEGDGLSKGGQFLISFPDRQDFYILAFPDIFLTPVFRTDVTAEHRKHS